MLTATGRPASRGAKDVAVKTFQGSLDADNRVRPADNGSRRRPARRVRTSFARWHTTAPTTTRAGRLVPSLEWDDRFRSKFQDCIVLSIHRRQRHRECRGRIPANIWSSGNEMSYILPKFVKIVIKLPAELMLAVQSSFAVQDTETVKERQ